MNSTPKLSRELLFLLKIAIGNFHKKRWISLVIIASSAVSMLVMLGFMSAADGFKRALNNAGSPNVYIATKKGAVSESQSSISNEQYQLLLHMPGVAKDPWGWGWDFASGEITASVPLIRLDNLKSVNTVLRGMDGSGPYMREGFTIVEGRMFEKGTSEVIVGAAMLERYRDVSVGNFITLSGVDFKVVGAYVLEGEVFENELWAHIFTFQEVYALQNQYQSFRFILTSASAIEEIQARNEDDPRLKLEIQTEQNFYKQQSSDMVNLIAYVAWPVSITLIFAASISVFNTMLMVLSERNRELVILRQNSFTRRSILIAVLIEAMVFSVVGAIIGALFSFFVYSGIQSSSTVSGLRTVEYNFYVSPGSISLSIAAGLLIGFFACFIPAIRAANTKLKL